jgi:hypothetical protein
VKKSLYNAAAMLLDSSQMQEAETLANTAAQIERENYPLLFEKTNRSVMEYIALCDVNRKKNKP